MRDSTREANNQQWQMYQQNRADAQSWRTQGEWALSQMRAGLGGGPQVNRGGYAPRGGSYGGRGGFASLYGRPGASQTYRGTGGRTRPPPQGTYKPGDPVGYAPQQGVAVPDRYAGGSSSFSENPGGTAMLDGGGTAPMDGAGSQLRVYDQGSGGYGGSYGGGPSADAGMSLGDFQSDGAALASGFTGGDLSADPIYGGVSRDFSLSDFQTDPGYQFRMQQGMDALQNSAAARGGLMGGDTGRALAEYGQNFASNEFQNAFNRYQQNRQFRAGAERLGAKAFPFGAGASGMSARDC